MTKLLDEAIAKLKALPEEDQADAAAMLDMFVEQRSHHYTLTGEQIAEVERIMQDIRDGRMEFVSEAEMDEIWKKYEL